MIFLAFSSGTWLALRRARSAQIKPEVIIDLVIWILISSLLGARVLYVLTHLGEFQGRWLDVISPVQSDGTIGIAGLVVLGGVLLAIPAVWWFLKKRQIPFLIMMDILIPSLALGMGIGRIGCLLNGCCFGIPTDLPWGIVFPETCLAGSMFPQTHIHPTQFYEIFYGFLIVLVLILRTPHKRFEGELFYLFFVMYGPARFFNETVRYYRESMILAHFGSFSFTVSMFLSLVLTGFGLFMLTKGRPKTGKQQHVR